MRLALAPPVQPMLCSLERELPAGECLYEPKWDGFRCLAFWDGHEVCLQSRHRRPLARYFPELVAAVQTLPAGLVLDGEIMVPAPGGSDFAALLARLHPAASRVERLSRETPAAFVAFDLLAAGGEDLRSQPFEVRRARLEDELAGSVASIAATPSTRDRDVAASWLERFEGVIAKDPQLPYLPGRRAMVKVKRDQTLDCVVGGFRLFADELLPSSLLLGLFDDAGQLRHVGVAGSFSKRQREQLLKELRPLVVGLEGHPWENGFLTAGSRIGRLKGAAARWVPGEMEQDWTAVEPARVCEVAYTQLDHDRLRHPARFRRWRPDRDARSCTFAQVVAREGVPAELLGAA